MSHLVTFACRRRNPEGKRIIVIAWAEMDDFEPTGRQVMRDGYYRPELRPALKARALVWSRDLSRLAEAKAHAKREGHSVYVMADTSDVLDRARDRVTAEHRKSAGRKNPGDDYLAAPPSEAGKSVHPKTWPQFFDAEVKKAAKEYDCTHEDAEPGVRARWEEWLDWHKAAIKAGWDPPQTWINSTRALAPEWWTRRIEHDLPDAFDRMVRAGRVTGMTRKAYDDLPRFPNPRRRSRRNPRGGGGSMIGRRISFGTQFISDAYKHLAGQRGTITGSKRSKYLAPYYVIKMDSGKEVLAQACEFHKEPTELQKALIAHRKEFGIYH